MCSRSESVSPRKYFWNVVALCLVVLAGQGEPLVIRDNAIRLRVLEYSSKNGSLQKVLNSRYSDLVVGEEVDAISQIVLECSSLKGPLRWIYSGDGQPQHKSYYTTTTTTGSTLSYIAYVSFPNGLSSKDTGQYSCQNAYNASINNYAYLFVPKRNLDGTMPVFIPNGRKHEVAVSASDKTVRIPCSVVHPNVNVSLERVSPQKSFWLDRPMRVPYSAKTGFTIPVSTTMREKFTCRGEFKGVFEEVTYVTAPQQPRIESEAELLHDSFPNRHRPTQSESPMKRPRPFIPAPETHLVSACTPQYCGVNAECIVKDYNPYCVCFEHYTGDPKIGCQISDMSQHLRVENPCQPSPCGPNSECIEVNGHPLCTCQPGFFGSPPSCQSHKLLNCSKNYDCEWTEFCNTQTKKCENICEGSVKFCAKNAICTSFSHMPYCTCPPGGTYVGDPYDTDGVGCQLQSERIPVEGSPSCNPNPCGVNAFCRVYSSYPLPICSCPPGFTGEPSHRCYKIALPPVDAFRPQPTNPVLLPHPQPVRNPENQIRLCTRNMCGENANCRIRQNHPECVCRRGYRGDPYKTCHRTAISPSALREACSVCGGNSVCSLVSSEVRCLCAPDTTGTPPNCKRVSTTASPNIQQVPSALPPFTNNACRSDVDCPSHKVCYTRNNKCVNPCSWACSETAECSVTNHRVQCRCPIGFSGDARIECTKIPKPESDQQQALPENHPGGVIGGPNSVCRRVSLEEMRILRREALAPNTIQMERDPFQRALIENIKQVNDIKFGGGTEQSGSFSECKCRLGYVGNPYSIEGCSPTPLPSSLVDSGSSTFHDLQESPSSSIVITVDPCRPSPCGENSLCVAYEGKAFCRCDYDAQGTPPNCTLRCRTDKHCLFDQKCLHGKCIVEDEGARYRFSEENDNSIR